MNKFVLRKKALLIISLLLGSIFFLVNKDAYAEPVQSWSLANSGEINISESFQDSPHPRNMPGCIPKTISVEQHADTFVGTGCVLSSGSNDIAIYGYNPNDAYGGDGLYAMKRQGDAIFHRIASLSGTANLTLLSNNVLLGASLDSNTVLKLYHVDGPYSMVTEEYINHGDYNTKIYNFEMSRANFIEDDEGNKIYARHISASSNNMYAVVEVYGQGIARVDLTTKNVTLIAKDAEMIPGVSDKLQIAISNDGKSIATFGEDSSKYRVYTFDGKCGRSTVELSEKLKNPCKFSDFSNNLKSYIPETSYIYDPSFSNNNTDLSIKIRDSESNRSILATIKPAVQGIYYLALGDSYTSGDGDIDPGGRTRHYGSTNGDGNCRLSDRSYPYLIRSHYNIPHSSMKSVACTNAHVRLDYYGDIDNYWGQSGRLIGKVSGHEQLKARQQSALSNFTPGEVPQLEFIKKYKPNVVTLTGGGNDVGFADIMGYCAKSFYTCTYAKRNSADAETLRAAIDTQYNYNRELVEKIKESSPETRVVIIGYPSFIASGTKLCNPNAALLDSNERNMINEALNRLNKVLNKVAYDTDVDFVDIQDVLKGGRICEGSEYVTGLSRAGYIGSHLGIFHPNSKGHKKIADSIISRNIMVQKSTPNKPIDFGFDDSKISLKENLVPGGEVLKKGVLQIIIDSGFFAANSIISAILHSDNIYLGGLHTNVDGSVRVSLDANSLPVGSHLLTLSGKTPTGKPIELYQFVDVKAAEDDRDGDGIPDSEDNCNYIEHWYDEETGEDVCTSKNMSLKRGNYKNSNEKNNTTINNTDRNLETPIDKDSFNLSNIAQNVTNSSRGNTPESHNRNPKVSNSIYQSSAWTLISSGIILVAILVLLLRIKK